MAITTDEQIEEYIDDNSWELIADYIKTEEGSQYLFEWLEEHKVLDKFIKQTILRDWFSLKASSNIIAIKEEIEEKRAESYEDR